MRLTSSGQSDLTPVKKLSVIISKRGRCALKLDGYKGKTRARAHRHLLPTTISRNPTAPSERLVMRRRRRQTRSVRPPVRPPGYQLSRRSGQVKSCWQKVAQKRSEPPSTSTCCGCTRAVKVMLWPRGEGFLKCQRRRSAGRRRTHRLCAPRACVPNEGFCAPAEKQRRY